MKVIPANLPDALIIEPRVFGDERGFFLESWNERTFSDAGIEEHFVQDNHSRSTLGVLRGLHYQIRHPQGKLLRVLQGSVFDVIVDLRRSSTHFGRWDAVELSAENKRMIWVPPGFAHGFLVTSQTAEVSYKVSDVYSPQDERTLAWNDPSLSIAWPLDGRTPILSAKDMAGVQLERAEVFD
ncbi:MAG: dTDP-4-dehydrorhamnose 3,5-epimerase [Burkholderiales bacterium]|nr:dTDP-4-dehydrorhamnose 3,5-epimerase [Burkholderiales bacterium]